MNVDTASEQCASVVDEVGRAVITDRFFLESVLTGILARGHVLLEDVPGTGKTLTARSMATALGLAFNRIQFTPDLLPSDITGTHVYNEQSGEFEFTRGPIFSNVVLADEINRAPPKTQAALLEAMEEGQVTVDGDTHQLPDPFFVIATQNPVEQEGTFQLPEAQLDRFTIKTSMGYPEREGELELLDRRADRTARAPTAGEVVDAATVREMQAVPESVTVADPVREYIVDVCRKTREHQQVHVGISPRGIQRLFEASRAYATLAGRDFVTPDDVKTIARPVLQHRVVLTAEANVRSVEKADVVDEMLGDVAVPTVES
jgi:MoxR-like ATPase